MNDEQNILISARCCKVQVDQVAQSNFSQFDGSVMYTKMHYIILLLLFTCVDSRPKKFQFKLQFHNFGAKFKLIKTQASFFTIVRFFQPSFLCNPTVAALSLCFTNEVMLSFAGTHPLSAVYTNKEFLISKVCCFNSVLYEIK